MAKGNRTYKRDSRGRFASGGGGGGGGSSKGGGGKSKGAGKKATEAKAEKQPKGASTRAKNTARIKELKAKGTVALGDRIKAKGFSGGKVTQVRASQKIRKTEAAAAETVIKGGSKASTVGRGGRAARLAAISRIRNKGRR
jgi:hypothetical protein